MIIILKLTCMFRMLSFVASIWLKNFNDPNDLRQVYYKCRRDSRSQASPERRPSTKDGKYPRLTRQSTAIDDSCWPGAGRRGSQPTLSPDPEEAQGRKARRDSLSPDSASCAASRPSRRDSRARYVFQIRSTSPKILASQGCPH